MARHAFQVDGDKIREARLASGWSQSELARAVETSERNIARWEAGDNQPRIESVAKIAEATGQPINFFLQPGSDNGAKLLEAVEGRVDEAARRLSG